MNESDISDIDRVLMISKSILFGRSVEDVIHELGCGLVQLLGGRELLDWRTENLQVKVDGHKTIL